MSDAALRLRLLTVAIVLPAFLAALWFLPNAWWALLMLGVTLVASREWARLAGFAKPTELAFGLLLTAACALLWFGIARGVGESIIYGAATIFWALVAPLCLRKKCHVHGPTALVVGLVMLVPTWLAVTRMQHEPLRLLLAMAVVWVADSAAYFTGLAFGRHKLAPAISPGKTWEGVMGAFVAVALYAFALAAAGTGKQGTVAIVVICAAMTALSIVGDLFESLCKRQAGVKDSGNVLPGHGGILDRIDGLVAALPLAAWLLA
jgi:phosphatidate cytidylyltransferase